MSDVIKRIRRDMGGSEALSRFIATASLYETQNIAYTDAYGVTQVVTLTLAPAN